MQSGTAKTKHWILECQNDPERESHSPLEWQASDNTVKQIKLRFDTKEEALTFAEKNNLNVILMNKELNTKPNPKPKSYTDNFSFYKVET